jgi:TP901 family phage tail tape measure protein
MADPALKISAELTGLEKSAQKALANIEKRARIKIQLDDRASLPLGRISKNASEVEQSLDAATSRVVAFGAAAAVFATAAKSFDVLINAIVNVDDALTRINVNFGATQEQLKSFGKEVFAAAKNTSKTFEEAAGAAEELARQGLSTEETIKRLNDALILSRRAGISSAEAVGTLTAAYNSFKDAGLTTTEILNKLVAVDTQFAISTRDASEAISRSASVAQEAGVTFDEFLGIITAVQQTTARGGAVISNGLKTIFTRVQAAPETIKALQAVGVAIEDSAGKTTTAGQRLRQYAEIRKTLSDQDKAYYDRLIAGTQQINTFTAAIKDLGEANGIAARAQKISSQATDEAIVQNEELNKTLKSVISQTSTQALEFGKTIGDKLGERLIVVLDLFNKIVEVIGGAKEVASGIANVFSGPVLVAGLVLLAKTASIIAINTKEALVSIAGLSSAAQARLEIEKQIAAVVSSATQEERNRLDAAATIVQRREVYLSIEQRVTQEIEKQKALSASLATSIQPAPRFGGVAGGLLSDFSFRKNERTTSIGNFADPLRLAIEREKRAGVPASQIYVDTDPRLRSNENPLGLMVANRIDEPLGGFQGVNRAIKQGANPKKYGKDIPNFAEFNRLEGTFGKNPIVSVPVLISQSEAKEFRSLFSKLRTTGVSSVDSFKQLSTEILKLASDLNITESGLAEINTKIKTSALKLTKNIALNEQARRDEAKAAVIEEKASLVRQRDFFLAQKQLPKIDIPKEITAKVKPLTFEQKAAQLGTFTQKGSKPFSTKDPEYVAFKEEQDNALKQRQIDDLKKRIEIRNQTQYQSPIGPIFQPAPSIFRGGSSQKISEEVFNAARKAEQSIGQSGLGITAGASASKFNTTADRLAEIERKIQNRTSLELRNAKIKGIIESGSLGQKITQQDLNLLKDEISNKIRASDPVISKLSNVELEESPRARARLNKLTEESFDKINKGFLETYAKKIRSASIQDSVKEIEGKTGIGDIFKREGKLRGALEKVGGAQADSPEVQDAIRRRLDARRSKINNAALGAAFIAPFAQGFLPEGTGGTAKGQALGAASGALGGIGIGALFGPQGAAIGAVVGAAAGAFKKLTKSTEELSKEFDRSIDVQSKSIEAIGQIIQTQEQLSAAQSPANRRRIIAEQNRAFGNLEPGVRKQILAAGGNEEKIRDIFSEQSAKLERTKASSASSLALNAVTDTISSKVGGLIDKIIPDKLGLGGIGDIAANQFTRAYTGNFFGGEKSQSLGNQLAPLLPEDFASRIFKDKSLLNSAFKNSQDINQGDIEKVQNLFDDLAKTLPEFKNVKVNASSFQDLAQALVYASTASKQLTEDQKNQTKIETERLRRVSNLNSFVDFTRETGTPLKTSAFLSRSQFGLPESARTQEAQDRSLLESLKTIQSSNEGILPENLKELEKSAKRRLGAVGATTGLESLITGLTGRDLGSLGLIGAEGKRNDVGILRTAESLAKEPGTPASTREQLLSLIQIQKEKNDTIGIKANNGQTTYVGSDENYVNRLRAGLNPRVNSSEFQGIFSNTVAQTPVTPSASDSLLQNIQSAIVNNQNAAKEISAIVAAFTEALREGVSVKSAREILIKVSKDEKFKSEFDGIPMEQVLKALTSVSDLEQRVSDVETAFGSSSGKPKPPKVSKLKDLNFYDTQLMAQ